MTAMSERTSALVRRRLLFIGISVVFSLSAAVIAAELILRVQAAYLRGGESMTPGLITYDRRLGWRLQPNWKGDHKHRDYSVRYQISAQGFRGPWPKAMPDPPHDSVIRVAVVGDSFTFGLGADEVSTFARQLEASRTESPEGNTQSPPHARFQVLNLGVPGYSTDQELLLLESVIAKTKIDRVVLVVCLINDVFDNERLFPLQAMQGKPRFRLRADGTLKLENVPVPSESKPAAEMRENLASLVIADSAEKQNAFTAWLGHQEIARRLGIFQPTFDVPPGFYLQRFGNALDLFDALVNRAQRAAQSGGATFTLALLPGRSFVEEPSGYSARYQEYLRKELSKRIQNSGIEVIDLASPLRASQVSGEGPFFHPNDGHLNAVGHAKVASLLRTVLDDQPSEVEAVP